MTIMASGESYGIVDPNPTAEQKQEQQEEGKNLPNMRLAFGADEGNGGLLIDGGLSVSVSSMQQEQQQQQPDCGVVESTKRKRGRPRKYIPDGSMGINLTSPPPLPPAVSLQSSPKKVRGRPPGSTRKHQFAPSGIGFTAHVITVKAGEDVSAKIMSFPQNDSQAVCILSANGAVSNVTLRQAAMSGGTVTYEGRFEILSLSGSFLPFDSSGQRIRTGGLSIILAGSDGCLLGGGVSGLLTAACPVQVVVGSFNAEGLIKAKSVNQSELASALGKLIPGASAGGSRLACGTLGELSGIPGSPFN